MNKIFEELLSKKFPDLQKKNSKEKCNDKQFVKNKETLKYLEDNPIISKISGFDKLKEMKSRDILKHYFSLIEFEQSIKQLEKDKEDSEYIQSYIFLANGYIDYFLEVNDSS